VVAYWESVVRPELVATSAQGRRPAVPETPPEERLTDLQREGWALEPLSPQRLARLMGPRLRA